MQAPIPEVAPFVGGDYVNGTGKKGTRLSSWMIGNDSREIFIKKCHFTSISFSSQLNRKT